MTSNNQNNTDFPCMKISFVDDEKKTINFIFEKYNMNQTFKHKKNCVEKVKSLLELEHKTALRIVNEKLGIYKKPKVSKPKRTQPIENNENIERIQSTENIESNNKIIELLQKINDRQEKLEEKVEEIVLKQNTLTSVSKKLENLDKKVESIEDFVFEIEETEAKTFQKICNIENHISNSNEDKENEQLKNEVKQISKNVNELLEILKIKKNNEIIETTESIENNEEVKSEVSENEELPFEENISMEITKSDDEDEIDIKPKLKLPNFKLILDDMQLIQDDMTDLIKNGECDWIRTDEDEEEALEENDTSELIEDSFFIKNPNTSITLHKSLKDKVIEFTCANEEVLLLQDFFGVKNIVKRNPYDESKGKILYNLWGKEVGKVNIWSYEDDYHTDEYELYEDAMDKHYINATIPLRHKGKIENEKEKLGKNKQQIKFKLYHYDKTQGEVTNTMREVGVRGVIPTRQEVAIVQPYNDYDFYFEDEINN